MKFKIGDRVECISSYWYDKVKVGDKGTIIRDGTPPRAIWDKGFEYTMLEGEVKHIRKVEDKIMTKKDMVVGKHYYTQRNGNKYEWGEENITEYREDLTDIDGYSGYDIMEVYEVNPTPVYKREEVKEMTVAEIEKLVGCKVKIVKGDE